MIRALLLLLLLTACGRPLTENERAYLSTIHGAKGSEADTVFVIPDMATASYREYRGEDEGFDCGVYA